MNTGKLAPVDWSSPPQIPNCTATLRAREYAYALRDGKKTPLLTMIPCGVIEALAQCTGPRSPV